MRPAPFYRQGPKLKNAALLALPWLLCLTVSVRRQETGTSRGPKLKNAALVARAHFHCITALLILSLPEGNQTRYKDQQSPQIEKCCSDGPSLVPLYYWISIKTRERDQQRPKVEKCCSAGPCLLSYYHFSNTKEPGKGQQLLCWPLPDSFVLLY